MSEWILLGIGLLLTIGTGLFVASEFALVNLDRADLESRRAKGETRLGLTIEGLKITSTHLSSAQLGITLTTLLTGYTMEPAISSLLADPLRSNGIPEGLVRPVGAITAVVVATLLSMIVGELVPKSLALQFPTPVSLYTVIPMQWSIRLLSWFIVVLNGSGIALLRMLGVPQSGHTHIHSPEELEYLIAESRSGGLLEPREHARLR